MIPTSMLILLFMLSMAKSFDNGESTQTEKPTESMEDLPLINLEESEEIYKFLNCSQLVYHHEFLQLHNDSLFIPQYLFLYSSTNYYLVNNTAITCQDPSRKSVSTREFSDDFISCFHAEVDRDDFSLQPDGQIYVENYRKMFEPVEYYVHGHSVHLCLPNIDDMEDKSSHVLNDKFHDGFSYLTFIGLLISILCLVSHLFVFCAISAVRNLFGCCLASLSLSLLIAYVFFIVIGSIKIQYCSIWGLCAYYFFLCAFFWMNAIAFDIWRSFRVVVKELRITSHRVPWRRFLLYSLYSWVVPGLLTILVKVADTTDIVPVEFKPTFDNAYCWFGKRSALTVFFALPLGCVLLLNLAFFLDVTCVISRASLTTSQSQNAHLKKRFFMFLKLAVIMGFTWIMGLIAGYFDHFALWCLFIIFNTLQGVSIFVVFSCSSKVRQLIFQKYNLSRKQRASISVSTISQLSTSV